MGISCLHSLQDHPCLTACPYETVQYSDFGLVSTADVVEVIDATAVCALFADTDTGTGAGTDGFESFGLDVEEEFGGILFG